MILLVCNPKAASTSLRKALAGHVINDFSDKTKVHRSIWEWAELYDMTDVKSLGVCRHPVDRFISAYWYFMKVRNHRITSWEATLEACLQGRSINDFVQSEGPELLAQCALHFMPQCHFLKPGYEGVDRVARFESLEKDLNEIFCEWGIEVDSIPKLNVSENQDREKLTDRNARKIEWLYAQDMNEFGYDLWKG